MRSFIRFLAVVALATTLTASVATAAEPKAKVRLVNPTTGYATDVDPDVAAILQNSGYRTPTPEEEALTRAEQEKREAETRLMMVLGGIATLIGGYFTMYVLWRLFTFSVQMSPRTEQSQYTTPRRPPPTN
jgi:hypothetical protein